MGLFDGLLGGGQPVRHGGPSPIALGLMGLLAYGAYQAKNSANASSGAPMPNAGAGGGLGGLLGGLFGGGAAAPGQGAGGMLAGGLGELVRRFQDNGKGEVARSWVDKGPNNQVDPTDIERVAGRNAIQTLADHSGKTYDEVLQELSRTLPTTVDALTPEGRMPTAEEANRWA